MNRKERRVRKGNIRVVIKLSETETAEAWFETREEMERELARLEAISGQKFPRPEREEIIRLDKDKMQ
jgi:predicted ribosome quality control (RQC) complex YloA/Tae2 family protein